MRRRYIFWQIINSIHQSAFLDALSDGDEVFLVTTDALPMRTRMGWTTPVLERCTLLSFDSMDWRGFISEHNDASCIHVFAGLHAFPKVHAAFEHAVASGCRVGIYAEPLRRRGLTGWLKDLRGYADRRRYEERIGFILCIGEEAERQFLHWGFPEHKLFSWAYVTEIPDLRADTGYVDDRFGIIFPASLIHRKGADILLEAAAMIGSPERFRLDCYSVDRSRLSAFEKKLIRMSEGSPSVKVHPFVDNPTLVGRIAAADLTVLPSRFDGWGAVVNESLSVGTPVLVSRHCGSASLLRGRPTLGSILPQADVSSLAAALEAHIRNGKVPARRRSEIREWASSHISGAALAAHFRRIVDVAECGSRERVTAPWASAPETGVASITAS